MKQKQLLVLIGKVFVGLLAPLGIAWSIGMLSSFALIRASYNEIHGSWFTFVAYVSTTILLIFAIRNRLMNYFMSLRNNKKLWIGNALILVWFFCIYILFGTFGWHTRCDTCKLNNLWYGTSRINPLYPFQNIGMAYVEKAKGYTIPSGYLSVPAVWGHFVPDRWLKDKTWHTIMPIGMVAWIAMIAGVDSVLLLALFTYKKT